MWKYCRSGGIDDKITLSMLKSVKNKMEVEKLVFPSLQHEERTDEMIDKFVETMMKAYDFNINVINQVIEKMESKSEKDGK